jgi:hypothetical protein
MKPPQNEASHGSLPFLRADLYQIAKEIDGSHIRAQAPDWTVLPGPRIEATRPAEQPLYDWVSYNSQKKSRNAATNANYFS